MPTYLSARLNRSLQLADALVIVAQELTRGQPTGRAPDSPGLAADPLSVPDRKLRGGTPSSAQCILGLDGMAKNPGSPACWVCPRSECMITLSPAGPPRMPNAPCSSCTGSCSVAQGCIRAEIRPLPSPQRAGCVHLH